MKRNLKLLGSIAAAIFATATAVAPGVSAAIEFEYESGTTTVSGSQGPTKDKFVTAFGAIECNTAKSTGTVSGSKASSLTLTPTYEDCTPTIGTTTVTTNGCDYLLHAGETVGTSREGSMDIVCPAEKQIVMHVAIAGVDKCTITIPAQKAKTTVTYDNGTSEGKDDITATINISSIAYSEVEGTGIGSCVTNSSNNGKLTAEWTLTAGNKGIWIDKEAASEFGFKFEAGTTIATAAQGVTKDKMSTTFAVFECKGAKYSAPVSGTKMSALSLAPSYEGCSAVTGGTVTWTLNGCEYLLKVKEKVGEIYIASFDIVCPAGQQIVIHDFVAGVEKCKFTIPPQTAKTTVSYDNGTSGGKEDVTVTVNVKNIEYTEDPGLGIAKCSSGTSKTGEYVGRWTLTGEDKEGNLKNASVG